MFLVSNGQVLCTKNWLEVPSVLLFYFSFLFCRDIKKAVHYIWHANGNQVTAKKGSIIKLTECQWQKSDITCSVCH